MAAWQVDFHVVPRGAVGVITPTVLAETHWWESSSFPADYATRLAAVLQHVGSSSAGAEMWGREDSNRVDLSFDQGRVSRVTVRVDVRRLDSKFGAVVIDLARKANAVLIRGDGLVVEPRIAAFAGALRGSNAWRFASDAAAFLSSQSVIDEDASEE